MSATLLINHTLSSIIIDEFAATIAPPVFAEFSSKYTFPLIDAVESSRKIAPPEYFALFPVKLVQWILDYPDLDISIIRFYY